MRPSLELFRGPRRVFSSAGRWLHPLFELEDFLAQSGLDPYGLRLRDRIVGKAAAFLIVRLGIPRLQAGVLSRLGKQVLEDRRVQHSWQRLVERIDCQTEAFLENVEDPEQAYVWLRQRAGRWTDSMA
jgi:zinc transport system ATP-binding protein